MRTEAARLNRLVQQIIELSRLQGDEALDRPAPVDVDRVVSKVLDTIDVEARAKEVEVVFDGRHGLQILGSENQVLLALSNLVSNAVTYSSAHSKVVVTALNEGLSVDITVADRGVGIPEEELDRIFERFYRVDPARHRSTGGTGLGLSIVKHVAASHGGEVRVWSQPGEGSAFTLSLPRRLTPTPVPGAHARPRPVEPSAEPRPEKENP
jgi:two-component system sensor histidine kinase SenX3